MTRTRDASFDVAEAACGLSADALAPQSLQAAKRLVADSLAVGIAGCRGRDTQAVHALAENWGGRAECSLIGSRLRVPMPHAALVNGTAIQALDFDDTHDPSAAHTASTVLAAALAVGEARGSSGMDLILALVAGVEVAARVGLASHTNIGFTSTAVYGVFGATVAAARLLGLDARTTRHALGIAISQAAGTSQTAIDRPLSKHIQSGFAAQAGVTAALLAQHGVSGVEQVFEGTYGFFEIYKRGKFSIEPLLAPWGPGFQIERLSLKPWPSCRGTHGPIEAALALQRAGIDARRIAAIDVEVPRMAMQLCGNPKASTDDPEIAAQFSIAYTVATALIHGSVSLKRFTREAIADSAVRALAGRVTIRECEGSDFVPARITVTLDDGSVRAHRVECLTGSPELPLSEADLRAKVEDCLGYAPAGCAAWDGQSLLTQVKALETLLVRDLMAGVVPDPMESTMESRQ